MIVEAGHDEAVAAWLKRLGVNLSPPFVTMAILEDGKVIAAAIFNNYQDSNIDMSVVFGRRIAMNRGNLRAVFQYPFIQLGVERISVRTRASNLFVRKLIRRLGFKPEGKQPKWYGTEPAFLYGMLRSDCKWL